MPVSEAPVALLNKVLKMWKSHPDLNACQGHFPLVFEQHFKRACWFSWVNESSFILLHLWIEKRSHWTKRQSSAKRQTKRQILKGLIKANLTWIFTDINLISYSFKQKMENWGSCSSLMWVNFCIVLVITGKAFIHSGLQLLFPVSPVQLGLALGDDPIPQKGNCSIQSVWDHLFLGRWFCLLNSLLLVNPGQGFSLQLCGHHPARFILNARLTSPYLALL